MYSFNSKEPRKNLVKTYTHSEFIVARYSKYYKYYNIHKHITQGMFATNMLYRKVYLENKHIV